jgi:hypothetical protein
MRTPKVSVRTAFGSTELDLRGVISDEPVIEIVGGSYFAEVKVIVPEGVEVELTGAAIFSSRTMHLAPVPRVPGTPEVRVHLQTWFSSVEIISKPYALPR